MATLQIDQTGIPAGTPDRSRTDGLGNGATVTLTSTGPGTTHTFTLLWVPEDDTTAVASLAQGGTTATFTPDSASAGGTYRIRLRVTDASGGVTETIRLFAIRTAAGLRIPALNEKADETASLENNGAAQIAASEMNEDAASGPFASGNYGGWYTALADIIRYTGDHKAEHIKGGLDEVDGDQLDIDFTPVNYTPSTAPPEVTDADHLSAHLSGIDTALATAGGGSPGVEGLSQVNLQFLMDVGDRNSYPGSGSTITDLKSNLAGTMTAVTITNNHFNFDDTTSFIDFGAKPANLENLFDGGGTTTVWFRAETDGSFGRVISSGGSAGNGWDIFTTAQSNGYAKVRFLIDFSTTDGLWELGSLVKLNTWNEVTVVYNSDSVANDPSFYLNGKAVTVTEVTTPVGTRETDASQNLVVGAVHNAPAAVFDGDIDVAVLWDRSLSLEEVEKHYSLFSPRFKDDNKETVQLIDSFPGTSIAGLQFVMDAGLRSSYPGSGTEITDLVYGQVGGMTGITVTDGNLDFDGSTSIINFGSVPSPAKDIFTGGGTVLMWLNSDGVAAGRVLDTAEPSTTGGWDLFVNTVTNGAQQMRFEPRFSTTNGVWEWEIGAFTWVFIAITYNDGSAANDPAVWVNGDTVTVSELTTPAGSYSAEGDNILLVGASDTVPNNVFNGEINSVFMYDRVLSVVEIRHLYQATRPRYNTFVRQEAITTETITGTDTVLTDLVNFWPSRKADFKLYLNGVLQREGAGFDYTLSGRTITWLASSGTAVDMDTSDELLAVYEA